MAALAHEADPQLTGFTLHPPPEDGATAWRGVQPAVDRLARGETTHVNLDLQDFADRAHTVVAELVANAELLGRLRRLSVAGFFEFAVIDRLTQHLPALWYVGHMQQEEGARPKRVSPKMLDGAERLRRRMHRLAVYHLEGNEDEAPLLAGVTFLNDQSKLSNDLVTLADLYARHGALFARDPHFVATDEADARADSRAIRRARSEGVGAEVTWSERAAALYTLVQRDYKELRATGTWMLRDQPDDARARFPPMIERAGAPREDGRRRRGRGARRGRRGPPPTTPPRRHRPPRTRAPAPRRRRRRRPPPRRRSPRRRRSPARRSRRSPPPARRRRGAEPPRAPAPLPRCLAASLGAPTLSSALRVNPP
jgi:hypothetical protein